MITQQQLPRRVLVDSLYSTVCLACGDRKHEERTFCYACFMLLPPAFKRALYNHVGRGYEEAVLEAMNFLRAGKVHMPGAGQER